MYFILKIYILSPPPPPPLPPYRGNTFCAPPILLDKIMCSLPQISGPPGSNVLYSQF